MPCLAVTSMSSYSLHPAGAGYMACTSIILAQPSPAQPSLAYPRPPLLLHPPHPPLLLFPIPNSQFHIPTPLLSQSKVPTTLHCTTRHDRFKTHLYVPYVAAAAAAALISPGQILLPTSMEIRYRRIKKIFDFRFSISRLMTGLYSSVKHLSLSVNQAKP